MEAQDFKYLIIGDGRLAKHFARYFELSKIPHLCWSRRNPVLELSVCIAQVSHILLLISDRAIEPILQEHPQLRERRCIHCSGSLVIEGVPSCHPLMTFSDQLYSLEKYRQISFVWEKEGPSFNELFPALPNPNAAIPRDDKQLYHALCVLSGNFTTLLWSKLFFELKHRWAMDEKFAHPFLRQTYENLSSSGAKSLTGPLARNDQKTIQLNIDALNGDPFAAVYEAFVHAYAKSNSINNGVRT